MDNILQTAFLCIFLNKIVLISIKISLKFVQLSIKFNIGSDNGLDLARWQAIIWTNDG